MGQHEGSRSHDQEAEEAQTVGEPATEHGAGDEVQERQHDDLLIVGGAPPGREADDLQARSELDGEPEHVGAEEKPRELSRQERDGRHHADLAEPVLVLPLLRNRQRCDEADEHRARDPPVQLAARDQRQEAQRRQRVGHDPMNQPEPHSAASAVVGASGGASRLRDRLQQSQKAQDWIRPHGGVCAHALPGHTANGDPVAALEVRDRARRHVADPPLEADAPLFAGRVSRVHRDR